MVNDKQKADAPRRRKVFAAWPAATASKVRNVALTATAFSLMATMMATATRSDGEGDGAVPGYERSASLNPFAQRYNRSGQLYVPARGEDAKTLRQRSEDNLKDAFNAKQEGLWDRWDEDGAKGFVIDEPAPDAEAEQEAAVDPAIQEAARDVDVMGGGSGPAGDVVMFPGPGVGGPIVGGNGPIQNGGGNDNGSSNRGAQRAGGFGGFGVAGGIGGQGPGVGPGNPPAGPTTTPDPTPNQPQSTPDKHACEGGVPVGAIEGTIPGIVMPIVPDGPGMGEIPEDPSGPPSPNAPGTPNPNDPMGGGDLGGEVPVPGAVFLFPAGLLALRLRRNRKR